MTEKPAEGTPEDARETTRAELLPEEQAVGSEAPAEQAAAILADSDSRTAAAADGPDEEVEHRRADELSD